LLARGVSLPLGDGKVVLRTESIGRDDTLWLATLLVFPVIGLEQVLHTTTVALLQAPVYQALHWLSDGLFALPLGAVAVWSGHRVARRLGHRSTRLPDLLAHALAITGLFALLLVPGATLHEEADRLTHAHAQLAIHSHSPVRAPTAPDVVVAFVAHALEDGLAGQAIGLPLTALALAASARGRAQTARARSARSYRRAAAGTGSSPRG
jgi:predicted DNA repair protein MutK